MFDITSRDKRENSIENIFSFEKIDADLYKNKIRGRIAVKYGDEIHENVGVFTLRFNKDWSKLALWNFYYNDKIFTERIDIYPSKY